MLRVNFKKLIFYLFAALFFLVPLILWPFTSEVFEFNKMVLVYTITTLIVAAWVVGSVLNKKVIFRRTILDIPLLVFLGSQFLSSIASVDPRTSWLGYYSRFNGGLLSLICYSLLYWAYVSNINSKDTLKIISYSLLPGAFLVSVYAVMEHFGIDKNIWVQDVVNRVFSTLGQPNWLAAFLVALLPLTMAYSLKHKVYGLLSILFFVTLLFTKSRSGILGFVFADAIFWGFILIKHKKQFLKQLLTYNLLFIILSLAVGFPFSPFTAHRPPPAANSGPALETGGTESGAIRKIVWRGAIDIWKHYPILGTGVETFAYSYYKFRPAEHNLTSEWDFIYNKAHNEYLNLAANTGTFGLITYLTIVAFAILQISNYSKKIPNSGFKNSKNYLDQLEIKSIRNSLLAGYVGILITNFFGFSVVPVQLEMFLFPAFAAALINTDKPLANSNKVNNTQKFFLVVILVTSFYLLITISRYWRADTLYAKAKLYNSKGEYKSAQTLLTQAVAISPKEPLYLNELAQSSLGLGLSDQALTQSQKAISLSPANVNLLRSRAGMLFKLATDDPKYLFLASSTLEDAVKLAPTDAKLYYNLGLAQARMGQEDKALATIEKTIQLKPNYRDARFAYAILLNSKGKKQKAKEQLNYILQNINPNDSLVKQQLEEIK